MAYRKYAVRERNYTTKAIKQMVLYEGITDRGQIADELGITRKALTCQINRMELELKIAILEKLDGPKN